MADTSVQREVEEWVLKLSSGGFFEFDVVNAGRSIIGCISTSGAKTSSGIRGVGKIQKIHSDIARLSNADGVRRHLVIFTERDMFDFFAKEQRVGRVPTTLELLLAEIPEELRDRLVIARKAASEEVRPKP